jgi:hypothetical protein
VNKSNDNYMKIKTGKNEDGLTIELPYGPTYLVRWENIPDEWIQDEIDFTIEFWRDIEEESQRKILTREIAKLEVIEDIKRMNERDMTSGDLFTGLAWDEFEKELLIDKPFSISEIWDDADYWEA